MDWKENMMRRVFEGKTPTVLLGSGASISTGLSLDLSSNFPSMIDLAQRLCEKINPPEFSADDESVWERLRCELDQFRIKQNSFNFEAFLYKHPLPQDSVLLNWMSGIVTESFKKPHIALAKAIEGNPQISYPLLILLRKLLQATPASNPCLTVITPNYDLLVEYSCDLIDTPCLTGFSGKIIRKWLPQIGWLPPMLRQSYSMKTAKYLKLLKPHGSYAWYRSPQQNDMAIECFGLHNLDGVWKHSIVMPGPTKFAESLHGIHREHLHYTDHAFKEAQSLVILGYGFNDPHLEEHLNASLTRGIPAVCVTRELSAEAISKFVTPYSNMTCITSDGSSGCRVYIGNKQVVKLAEDLWKLDQFLNEFI